MKPFLFSAFVFPGSGYFLVKKPVYGGISAAIVLAILAVFVKEAFYKSQIISDRIIKGEIPLDIPAIREAILLTPGTLSADTLSLLTYLFIAVWVFSAAHCFKLGKSANNTAE